MYRLFCTIIYRLQRLLAIVVVLNIGTHALTRDSASEPATMLSSGDVIEVTLRLSDIAIDSFRIHRGDMLLVIFIDHPELTFEQCVRSDGMIALPYIGDIRVIDMTPQAVRLLLMERLAESLQNPQIVVALKNGGTQDNELRALMNQDGGHSRRLTVRADGCVSMPVVGDVRLAGKSIAQASQQITKAYQDQRIALAADVILSQPFGAMICVMGAVKQPGRFTLDRSLTLPEAIALAGGFTNDASLRHTLVINVHDSLPAAIPFDLNRWLKGRDCAIPPTLRAGDIICIPRKGIKVAAESVQDVGQIILLRGWTVDLGRLLFGG
jgi:polysaccharide export outer membrane protein